MQLEKTDCNPWRIDLINLHPLGFNEPNDRELALQSDDVDLFVFPKQAADPGVMVYRETVKDGVYLVHDRICLAASSEGGAMGLFQSGETERWCRSMRRSGPGRPNHWRFSSAPTFWSLLQAVLPGSA